MSTILRNGKLACIRDALGSLNYLGEFSSQEQFAAFEFMCRARAELAKKEMNYWLAEAEEWKQLRELPEPFIHERVTPDTGYSEPN